MRRRKHNLIQPTNAVQRERMKKNEGVEKSKKTILFFKFSECRRGQFYSAPRLGYELEWHRVEDDPGDCPDGGEVV